MPSGLELDLDDILLPPSLEAKDSVLKNCRSMTETKVSYSNLLEFAADNNLEAFKEYIGCNPGSVDEIALWYGRQLGSSLMVLEYRTPLMVAAMYGSVDVVKIIISHSEADINRTCSPDGTTALHYAASCGSSNAVDVVKLLLLAGADPNLADSKGFRPFDVINVAPTLPSLRASLQDLLSCNGDLQISVDEIKTSSVKIPEKKEYPIDPSIPDIKNSMYATDEFRMYSFKVRPCSRAYSHDWTECPFVHPGENARRRDPRKFHYSCVPCPDFRKGSCKRGDLCEYAHGVFECWLHPAQYRTRLCKDGVSCARRVCFFAHMPEELRPLYMSSSSSPSAAAIMDMAAALSVFPGSPSATAMVSPFPFTPPMSPTASPWVQQTMPTLHLPGPNNMSRLRSSLNARDISVRSNLDDLFNTEISSPRFSDQSVFSPSHKTAVMNHFQQQQSMLSPINTKVYGGPSSPRVMSPRGIDSPHSPLSARLSAIAMREKQNQQLRSLSSRELGSWESANGKADWSVNGDELGRLKRSYTAKGDEPDVSWVNSLVKDPPTGGDLVDHSALSAWLDELGLD